MRSDATKFWRYCMLAVCAPLLATLVCIPLGSDSSALQWVAIRFVRDGAIPYLNTWEPNFPGMLLFHLPAAILFGNSEAGFRLIEVVFGIGVLIVWYQLLLRWISPRAAFLSSLLYTYAYLRGGFLFYGQRDVFATGLFVIALACFYFGERRTRAIFFFGVLAGWMILIRPLYAVLPVALFIAYRKEFNVRKMVALVIGSSLFFALSVLFAIVTHSLTAYYESTVLFLARVYSELPGAGYSELLARLNDFKVLFGLAILQLLTYHFGNFKAIKWNKEERTFAILCAVLTLLSIIVQGRYLPYHFALLILLASVPAGVFLERVLMAAANIRYLRAAIWVGLVFLFVFKTPLVSVIRQLWQHGWRSRFEGAYVNHTERERRDEDEHVVAYLNLPQNVEGLCEVCSYDARLRLMLDREESTRFTEFQGVSLPMHTGDHPAFQQRWRAEFLDSLQKKRVRFVVLNGYMMFWVYPSVRQGIDILFPEFRTLLNARYKLDTTIGSYEIYRLNED